MKLPFVSRDRYEAAAAEIARLQARVIELERARDAAAFGVLQSALRKHGYGLVGEPIAPFQSAPEVAPQWSSLDWRLYEAWARDYHQATGATDEEAITEYRTKHGNLPPSQRLIV